VDLQDVFDVMPFFSSRIISGQTQGFAAALYTGGS